VRNHEEKKMKALLVSIIVVSLMGALVGVGLFAYFNDTETSPNNTFTAGIVDLELDKDGSYYNGVNCQLFNVTGMHPGDTVEETLSLHVTEASNPGILEKMTLTVVADSDNDGGSKPPMPALEDYCDGIIGNGLDGTADGDLDTFLSVKLWWDDGDNIHQPAEPYIWQGMASFLTANPGYVIDLDYPINQGTQYYMGWELHFDDATGDAENIAMTDKWVVDAVFLLKQVPGYIP